MFADQTESKATLKILWLRDSNDAIIWEIGCNETLNTNWCVMHKNKDLLSGNALIIKMNTKFIYFESINVKRISNESTT